MLAGWKKEEASDLKVLKLMACEDLVNDSLSETAEPSEDPEQRTKFDTCPLVIKLSIQMNNRDYISKKDM